MQKNLIKRSESLIHPSEYIFAFNNFTVNNQEKFQTVSALHNINASGMKFKLANERLQTKWLDGQI